ncbi:MAG: alpha/beta hydrolase [Actinobacteria bacterium]|nr:alpha/beta hydrolase [Actinomycetota bacterium]
MKISANSVLPASRRDIELRTSDSLTLVGELARPVDAPPRACIICVHPLPTHGGMMDSHVLRKMAWRLPALADIAVLRFNTRGTSSARGRSEGTFDAGEGEGRDLAAAVEWVASQGLPRPWIVGWSFGTDVILRHARSLDVTGVILLSPPLRFTTEADFAAWVDVDVPVVALIPERDDYLPPDPARARFAVAPNIQLVIVKDAPHLWVGEKNVQRVLDEIVSAITGRPESLPREWDGPMERWSDL